MRRSYAVAIALAVLAAPAALMPGLASADATGNATGNSQAVNTVITRALSQRGVPFLYGGGNVAGPTRGTDRCGGDGRQRLGDRQLDGAG